MGWGRMLLLGNWGQQMDIEEQREEIESLKQQVHATSSSAATELKNRVDRLEKENGELRLYLAALVRYLGHRGIIREDEFRRLVETIDAEDGSEDGTYHGTIRG